MLSAPTRRRLLPARERRRRVIYSLTMPLVAITTAYVYFDRRVADQLAGDPGPEVLPAEIELSG